MTMLAQVLCFVFVALVTATNSNKHKWDTAKATAIEGLELIEPQNASQPEGWTLFKQCDSRWGGHKLGTCGLTICQAGCAMSSAAMMLATKGVNTNPGELNLWLSSHGGYANGCDLFWGKVNSFGKVTFQAIEKASEASICSGLAAGHGIIANVHGGAHWVLLTGCRGGGVFDVNDPGFNTATYTYSQILQEAVYH